MKYSFGPPNSSGSNPTGKFLAGVSFFCMGLFFWWVGYLGPSLSAYNSSGWQAVPCIIVGSEITVGHKQSYRPLIQFDYIVEGEKYRSETYDFTAGNRSRNRCDEIVSTNPVGKQTNCFYNPVKPENAVLVKECDFPIFGLLFSSVFVFLGAYITLSTVLSKRKSSNSSKTHKSNF